MGRRNQNRTKGRETRGSLRSSTRTTSGRFGVALTVVVFILAFLAGGTLYHHRGRLLAFATVPRHVNSGTFVVVTIPRGAGPQQIGRILEAEGLVTSGVDFARYVRFIARKERSLKAGDYALSPGMTPDEIVAILESDRPPEHRVTIPEGLRKEEVAQVVADAGFSTKAALLAAMNDPALLRTFGVPPRGANGQDDVPGGIEGYLFPDTYQFSRTVNAPQILHRMRSRLDEVIDNRLKARMSELGWDLHKTLTLAAIIEKETGVPDERAHISSVFHNRLRRGMRLQTDPTVIYGTANYDGNIRRADLLRPHPYNTYVIAGLPPGPIAQPGRAAIEAALFPITSEDLFFVAEGNTGRHRFCPNLACHNDAVRKWQVEFHRKHR